MRNYSLEYEKLSPETRKRQRRRNPSMAIKLITMFALVAALLFCVLIFFKVEVIEVEGSSHYSDEEIISASGLAEGDNLVLINKAAAARCGAGADQPEAAGPGHYHSDGMQCSCGGGL